MKKKMMKKIVLLLLLIVMSGCMCITVSAKSQNVTKKYKSSVTKMLRPFDLYLGYDIAYGYTSKKFVFNDYAKTSMIIYADHIHHSIFPLSVDAARKKYTSKLKLYFGNNTKFKVRKFKGYYPSYMKLEYLYQSDQGNIQYYGGDYSEYDTPKGTVTQVTKTSKNCYTANYKIYLTNDYYGTPKEYRGTYKIYLKKAKNKFGFIITNIKRTHVAR